MNSAKVLWDPKIFDETGEIKAKTPKQCFAFCLKKSGGMAQMADILGVSRQTIHANWHGRFPDKYVVAAEKAFGIPRKVLAPHLYE